MCLPRYTCRTANAEWIQPLPASLLLNITRREQIGPTWWAGTWPLSADRVKMRRAWPRCTTSRINDKRPVSSIIRQLTQNTVKVCFTLKQWHTIFPGKWFSGKRLSGKVTVQETSFRETSFRESSLRESDFPGNVRKPPVSLGKYHTKQNFTLK